MTKRLRVADIIIHYTAKIIVKQKLGSRPIGRLQETRNQLHSSLGLTHKTALQQRKNIDSLKAMQINSLFMGGTGATGRQMVTKMQHCEDVVPIVPSHQQQARKAAST